MVHSPRRGSGPDTDWLPRFIKNGRDCTSQFPQPLCSSPSSFLRSPKLQAWCRCYLFSLTPLPIMMFPKAFLAFLAIGALSVNALSTPVVREPTPELDCEFPR